VAKGKISVTSRPACGLIGNEVGDEAEVSAPGGAKVYEIEKVEFLSGAAAGKPILSSPDRSWSWPMRAFRNRD